MIFFFYMRRRPHRSPLILTLFPYATLFRSYIFYRTYIGKNGYYLNDDATAIATTDDYHRICLMRTIQKAVVICYKTYIDEILDSVLVDSETGKLSQPLCKAFEQNVIRAIGTNMSNEISGFSAFINPDQNLITSGSLKIQCKLVPTALLKEINVDLSFANNLAD